MKKAMWRHPAEHFTVTAVRYFSRHKAEVNCCSFSHDCQILLTCSDDGRLYLWNATSGKLLAKARGHTGPVKSCVFSRDWKLFASASHDCTVRIWRTSTTECLHVLTGHSKSVETVSFSPDSRWLVSGGWDRTVLLWDVREGKMVRVFSGHSGAIQSSAFSTVSQHVATGSWDYSIRVWNLLSEEAEVLEGHHGNVSCVCFSLPGMLASGSWDGSVRVWLPQKGVCLFVLGGRGRAWVRSLAFSRDGLLLASASEGDKIRIWDMEDGRCVRSLQGHRDTAHGCVFSPSGALLCAGAADLCSEEDDAEEGSDRDTDTVSSG